mgnify:CR=1 FL=1
MVWAEEPLNINVPLLWLNVPELLKFPAIFIFPAGAVNVPVTLMFLKLLVALPLIAVAPLNVSVPLLLLNVPLLVQLP